MAKYYVIRDKNTGLYFRGKGANRWGKHYNQATIYRVKGTAEHSIKEISWRGEQAEIVPIQIVEKPTDMVEVVRCDKCLHWDDHNNGYGYCKHPHWRYAGEYDALTEHCDFCSYGERREDNG